MTYLRNEKLEVYEFDKDAIYERPDGSSLHFAQQRRENVLIRARKDSDEVSKAIFANEKISLAKASKLKPYVLPIYSVISSNGKNYTIYRNPISNYDSNLLKNAEIDRDDEEKLKALITQYLILIRKANNLGVHPIENSSFENMIIDNDGKIQYIGFENAIPIGNGSKEGISTDVTKIANGDIGLKTDYIKAASFINYVFTGKSAITSDGLKILNKKIGSEALELINELTASKTSEEFKEFNPFKSAYLQHEPHVECGVDHITIDDLTFSWDDGISVEIGELKVSVNIGSSSITISEGDNSINVSGSGVELQGKVDLMGHPHLYDTVTINDEGIQLRSGIWPGHMESTSVDIGANGLKTDSDTGVLYIDNEGLNFNGHGEKLIIGEDFECTISEFKPKFGNPFEINTRPISLSLASEQVSVNLADGINVNIVKKPSLEILVNATSLTLNGEAPLSVVIGSSIVFQITKSGLDMDMDGVNISFEGGKLTVDADIVALSIGKSGLELFTYGVPFDMKSIKDKAQVPSFNFQLPEIKIPGIPSIPSIPKPKIDGEPDIGGCCSIF